MNPQGCRSRGGWGDPALHSVLGRSVLSTRGADYANQINMCPPPRILRPSYGHDPLYQKKSQKRVRATTGHAAVRWYARVGFARENYRAYPEYSKVLLIE
jgi:hypothetical protein